MLRHNEIEAVLATVSDEAADSLDDASGFLVDNDARILRTYGARLGSRYFQYLHFTARADHFAGLQASYASELSKYQPRLLPTSNDEDTRGLRYNLKVHSFAHPQTVPRIARIIAELGIDLAGTASTDYSPDDVNAELFVFQAKVEIPNGALVACLHRTLQTAADKNAWEFTLTPVGECSSTTPTSGRSMKVVRSENSHSLASRPATVHQTTGDME